MERIMTNTAYIYGTNNGATYTQSEKNSDPDKDGVEKKTHWDPRIQVMGYAELVQVGVVPPSKESTDEEGVWRQDDGQFLSLNRSGLSRLITALQEAAREVYGRDPW